MRIGTHVTFTDPKTHKQAEGVLDHVAMMRSGAVIAFIKPAGQDRILSIPVTDVQPHAAI